MGKELLPVVGAVAGTILAPGLGTAIGAGLGMAAGGILGGGASKPPAPPPPAPMPVMDTQAVTKAQREQAALAQAASGRTSTILSQTGTSDKLGG